MSDIRFSLLVVLFLALVGGGLVVVVAVGNSPAVVAAAAEVQRAKAAAEWARVEGEKARAAAEWSDSKAAAEWSATSSEIARKVAQNAPLFAAVSVGSFAILALGLSAAAAVWSMKRARLEVVYPREGVSPILTIREGGAIHVLDLGRALGSVTTISGGSVALPLAGDAETHAMLSGQAIAGAVVAGVAKGEDRAHAAAAVGEALTSAMATLPALASSQSAKPLVLNSASSQGGELRVIRRSPEPAPRRDVVKRGHMAEFIKGGELRGFGRREWAGKTFSDGTRISQTYWAILSETARAAGILVSDGPGWRLRGGVGECLAALDLSEFAQESQEELI